MTTVFRVAAVVGTCRQQEWQMSRIWYVGYENPQMPVIQMIANGREVGQQLSLRSVSLFGYDMPEGFGMNASIWCVDGLPYPYSGIVMESCGYDAPPEDEVRNSPGLPSDL